MIGYDPLSRSAWSGISYQVFSRVRDQDCVHRAFDLSALQKSDSPRRQTVEGSQVLPRPYFIKLESLDKWEG